MDLTLGYVTDYDPASEEAVTRSKSLAVAGAGAGTCLENPKTGFILDKKQVHVRCGSRYGRASLRMCASFVVYATNANDQF
eukprot:scaffold115923_cov18-Tisochrysis_lutea.AAC.2